ncbi:unnamed protein product [Linum trigynum]|uniref:RNase H type-1 domain-containing protein n=1 Tax=Linum trigynum TaxID=586398 RepID=A0AAV2CZE9_9ROSI
MTVTTQPVPEELIPLQVAHYWHQDHGWRLEDLEDYLSQETIATLRAFHFDPTTREEDQLRWKLTTNGAFSTKTAFQVISPHIPSTEQPAFWKSIWKLHVPERVRVFIWMVVKNKITTNSVRKFRHLTSDDSCPSCEGTAETAIHCLRDCPRAQIVWSKIISPDHIGQFMASDRDRWLRSNVTDNKTGFWPGEWGSFFSLVLWFIWKQRNEKVFRGNTLSPSSLCNYVVIKAKEWAHAWESASRSLDRSSKPARVEKLIGWSPPATGWFKLNTDGAAQGHGGDIAAGGIIRDSDGEWIAGFMYRIGSGTAILAELWGILQGLKLAWKHGIQFLILESYSALALDLIRQHHDPVHLHASLLGKIRRLLSQSWVVQLDHTYREGNRVADWLSKHSLVYPFGMHELEAPPSELARIIREDLMGVSFPRMAIREA